MTGVCVSSLQSKNLLWLNLSPSILSREMRLYEIESSETKQWLL